MCTRFLTVFRAGIRYAYISTSTTRPRQSTYCHQSGELVIERDWYRLGAYRLTGDGQCVNCGRPVAGVFEGHTGTWGRRLPPVGLGRPAVRYSGPGRDPRP
jgi:pyruvate formate lyase activating enzyme